MGNSKKGWIYLLLIIVLAIVLIDIWYVTNLLNTREIGYLIWEGGLTILLLLITGILTYSYSNDTQTIRGTWIIIGILIFSILLMINYASMIEFVDKLVYYLHMSVTASIILIIGVLGNISKIEKKEDDGFVIHIHSKYSPISPRMILPVWFLIFLAMGGLVMVSGTVLVQYPNFGAILLFFGGPFTSGFGVGDWENITLMILPFALSMLICKRVGLPNISCVLISLIIGMTTFTLFHSLVYSTNMVATIIVLMFSGISLGFYHYTKSLTIPSALHIGNNFWGALFNYSVVAFSAFGVTAPISNVIFSFVLIGVIAFIIFIIIRKFGRKKRR